MVYNKHNIGFIIRLILILLNLVLLSFIISNPNRLFSILILGGVLCLQIVEIIKRQHRLFNAIENFLSTLEHEDRNIRFTGRLPKELVSFTSLFNNMLQIIEKKKSENEAQFILLQELMKNVKVGVISITTNNKVEISNPTALQLLNLASFHKLDQIKNSQAPLHHKITECKDEFSGTIETTTHSFSVQISNLIINKQRLKLVSFQDIRHQIELKEMEAWHQLIRTLGHEILNSVTPISSMTETGLMLLEDEKKEPKKIEELTQNQIEKIRNAFSTVNRRSKGLLEFVENYRKLTRIPKPNFEKINLIELVEELLLFLKTDLENSNINVSTKFPNEAIFSLLDKNMIEQVMINLIKNSIQAMNSSKEKNLIINIETNHHEEPVLSVIDSGSGISEEIIDKIFIPFYTTKDDGTGIGLSLSRQIMQLHKGSITYSPSENQGSCFTLVFK